MSILTDVLNLFKYDPEADKPSTFNIRQALNENWDKLDTWAGDVDKAVSPTTEKKTPMASDSLVLTDSADAGKRKKLTFASLVAALRDALSTFFAALVHSHSMDDVTGLETSLSKKATVLPAATPESTKYATLLDYVRTLPQGFYQVNVAGFPDLPQSNWDFAAEISIVGSIIVRVTRRFTNGAECRVREVNNMGTDWFGEWVLLPTATKPEEHPLPLSEGVSAPPGYINDFFKAQNHAVYGANTVIFQPTDTMHIGTLPAGYRPKKIFSANASIWAPGEGHATVGVSIGTDGVLTYSGPSKSTGGYSLIFDYLFLAATDA